jgi:hypothetical protein
MPQRSSALVAAPRDLCRSVVLHAVTIQASPHLHDTSLPAPSHGFVRPSSPARNPPHRGCSETERHHSMTHTHRPLLLASRPRCAHDCRGADPITTNHHPGAPPLRTPPAPCLRACARQEPRRFVGVTLHTHIHAGLGLGLGLGLGQGRISNRGVSHSRRMARS